MGRCGECQQWGTVVERGAVASAALVQVETPATHARPISEVDAREASRHETGIVELDRVLGGGIVPGALTLLAGEPGVGKSTLLLEVAAQWSRRGQRTLYVTGEESAAQVRIRADRTGAVTDELYLAAEVDLSTILGHIEQTKPSLVVIDSIQTISTKDSGATPGGVAQIRDVTTALMRVAKLNSIAVVIIGHVTKDGAIAGPRMLEHLVDVVLSFEGDRHSGFRMVRGVKNRFGPADEVGCFEMNDSGIVEVPDPSGLFTSAFSEPIPGTCITVSMEGRRPLLAEIQSLVSPSPHGGAARRTTIGVEPSRVAMIVAVLERKAGLALSAQDVYVSTVGGARVTDPAVDLSIAVALASSYLDRTFPSRVVALGEIGLAGDLRRVPNLERRVGEAARLGFEYAVVPANSRDKTKKLPRMHGLKVVEAATVAQALGILDLRRKS